MKELVGLLNALKAAGVVRDFALFGAMAQMRYTEPVATLDADVLVLIGPDAGLDALSPIYRFCEERDYHPRGEAIQVGEWPVQFIPVFSPLTEEAVREAETGEVEGLPLRVVSAKHLAAIALSVGRAKDHTRVLSLLEAGAVTREGIEKIAASHGLTDKWRVFAQRFLDD